jgi:hypothetical protein
MTNEGDVDAALADANTPVGQTYGTAFAHNNPLGSVVLTHRSVVVRVAR